MDVGGSRTQAEWHPTGGGSNRSRLQIYFDILCAIDLSKKAVEAATVFCILLILLSLPLQSQFVAAAESSLSAFGSSSSVALTGTNSSATMSIWLQDVSSNSMATIMCKENDSDLDPDTTEDVDRQGLDNFFRTLDHKTGTLHVLVYLYHCGAATKTSIYRHLGYRHETLAGTLKLLLRSELVRSEEGKWFPRQATFRLTARGKILVETPIYLWPYLSLREID